MPNQDVLDAKAQIGDGNFACARRGLDREGWCCRSKAFGLGDASKVLDTHEHVGESRREAVNRDGLAR